MSQSAKRWPVSDNQRQTGMSTPVVRISGKTTLARMARGNASVVECGIKVSRRLRSFISRDEGRWDGTSVRQSSVGARLACQNRRLLIALVTSYGIPLVPAGWRLVSEDGQSVSNSATPVVPAPLVRFGILYEFKEIAADEGWNGTCTSYFT